MLEANISFMYPKIIGKADGLTFRTLVHQRAAIIDLELLCPAQRHFQTISKIVGDMITADRENPGMFDDAAGIDDIIGNSASNIDHQCAKLFLMRGEECQRRSDAAENDVLDLQLESLDRSNRILQAVEQTMDDVHVHLNACAKHSNGIEDAILPVDQEVLPNDVNNSVLGGEIDRLCVFYGIFDIRFDDFAVV